MFNFFGRVLICFSSILLPIFMIIIHGSKLESYSDYYYTDARMVFTGILLFVSVLFNTLERWKIPSILLLFILVFPNQDFPSMHQFFAMTFFTISVFEISRVLGWYWLWLGIGLGMIAIYDIFISEVLLVTWISIYHLRRLLIIHFYLRE